MKELSIEQKAKAYDEALEQARRFHKAFVSEYNYPAVDIKASYEAIFPELKESEDERIRKEIIEFITIVADSKSNKMEWLAWLEKQCEKSSNILHDVNEEPEEQREIFCEWGSNDAIWHDVVFYHADTKTFWNGEQRIEGVVKWAYIDEMLEKQGSPVLSNSSNISVI